MGFFGRCTAAISSRLVFVFHAIYSLQVILQRIHVNDATSVKESKYWLLTLILALIVLEGGYTMVIRKGHEYKYFWPSGFIYILIMIANICILEAFLMDEEIKCAAFWESNSQENPNGIDLAQAKLCKAAAAQVKDDQKLRAGIEIGMLGALVVGRWLMPRGELTRDQLSALLLAFIGNGADCIEFLNTWNDFPVLRNKQVTDTVLVLYSVSMLQFSVVTTKTTDEYVEDGDDENFFSGETTKPESGSAPPPQYAPGVPRYIQKLLREKSKSRASYHATLSSVTLALKDDHRSTRSSTLTTLKEPFTLRNSSFEVRARAFTLDKNLDDNVFEDEPTSPARKQQPNIASVLGKKKKRSSNNSKKIRFRADTKVGSSTTTDKNGNETTARYLQTLAHFGQWDEFSKILKEAQSSGFTRKSLRFSTGRADDLFDQHMMRQEGNGDEGEENASKEPNRFQAFLRRFPTFKSVQMDQDIFQTLILLGTLELPYFLARVVFTLKYNVSSTTMVFYTTKNVIMVIFLVYRLWVKFAASDEPSSTNDDKDGSRDLMNMKL